MAASNRCTKAIPPPPPENAEASTAAEGAMIIPQPRDASSTQLQNPHFKALNYNKSEKSWLCVVNLVHLDPPNNGGMSRVAKEVSQMLLRYSTASQRFQLVFVVAKNFADQFPVWLESSAIVFPYDPQRPPSPLLRALTPDILVSPLFGVDPFHLIPEFKGIPHITAVPDALAIDRVDLFTSNNLKKRQKSYALLKEADLIVTLTEFARAKLLTHLRLPSERIVHVWLGADAMPKTAVPDNWIDRIPRPFVYYPANTWLHKRHELLFKIMHEVWKQKPEMNLVLTGARNISIDVDLNALMERYSAPPDRVHDLQFVSDSVVQALYTKAEALLFVSEYEGFGMPIVEAMLHGCPVICAPLASIPEVAGDAALYVDSTEPDAWAAALLSQLPSQRASLIERGYERAKLFTWEKHSKAMGGYFA